MSNQIEVFVYILDFVQTLCICYLTPKNLFCKTFSQNSENCIVFWNFSHPKKHIRRRSIFRAQYLQKYTPKAMKYGRGKHKTKYTYTYESFPISC